LEAVWLERPLPVAARELVASGISPLLATLLAGRGVATPAEAERYLAPSVSDLHPASRLAGLEAAVDRLRAARSAGDPVVVVGDYDVDGVTASAILAASFRALGLSCEVILPSRRAGGYGLQPAHVERAVAGGARLLVTADCGMQAHEALDLAAMRGLDVIVTDHHLPGGRPPRAVAVVNPRQPGCTYPFPDLCAAGIALKLSTALFEASDREPPWSSLLRLASLGTIADAVALRGENRAIARLGLAELARTPSPGLQALFEAARISPPITASDVAFRIGPRLNAPGRVGDPDAALELLLTRDRARGRELASELERANQRRQALERRVLDDCAAAAGGDPPSILVAWSADWNKGVVGIAAGRLAREIRRPVILLACEPGGAATGSGRSVEGLDLHAALATASATCDRFGGHAQAIGMTVATHRLEEFRERCLEDLSRRPASSGPARTIEYDVHLTPRDVSHELVADLARLEPFGAEAPEPIVHLGPLELGATPRRFGNDHLGLVATAPGGGRAEIVAWQWGSRPGPWSTRFEILAAVELDRRATPPRPRLRLIDARPVAASAK
jgi:single-stranded-DNA-specific exonuclease